jgi:hypothetical protein
MRDNVRLIREITIDQAVDHFFPTDRIEPRALNRYEQHRTRLRLTIEDFCAGKPAGSIWLFRSTIWNPEALIGSEGIAFKPLNGPVQLLRILDY